MAVRGEVNRRRRHGGSGRRYGTGVVGCGGGGHREESTVRSECDAMVLFIVRQKTVQVRNSQPTTSEVGALGGRVRNRGAYMRSNSRKVHQIGAWLQH